MAKSKRGHKPHKSNPGGGGAGGGSWLAKMKRKWASESRSRHSTRNPLPISLTDALPIGGGAVVGGIVTSYGTNLVLGSHDSGWLGYLGNAAVAVLGSMGLNAAGFRRLAQGWLIGGVVMLFGRIFDDYFGQSIVTFNAPGQTLSSYYVQQRYVLPAPGGNRILSASGRRLVQAAPAGGQLPPSHAASAPINATTTAAVPAKLGWARAA